MLLTLLRNTLLQYSVRPTSTSSCLKTLFFRFCICELLTDLRFCKAFLINILVFEITLEIYFCLHVTWTPFGAAIAQWAQFKCSPLKISVSLQLPRSLCPMRHRFQIGSIEKCIRSLECRDLYYLHSALWVLISP